MERKMKTFQAYIRGIAKGKVLSRAYRGLIPGLTYNDLEVLQQKALIAALINDDDSTREFIAKKITNALQDAYCDRLRQSEAIEDAIDLRNFIKEDEAERVRDMNLSARGL
jgi:hypothetical protein